MPHAITFHLPAVGRRVPARRVAAMRDAVDRGVLNLLRLGLVLFVTYDGALIVRNVTHALCDASGRTPPAWTVH